jgi:tRNA U34 5-carboxymethylaminomethyl modifying GTPase MnmE/TrmE
MLKWKGDFLQMENNLTQKDDLIIALAGIPNSGKTSIFNHLTGAKQHVGN